MMKKGSDLVNVKLYKDVLAIREEIKGLKKNIESTESMVKAGNSIIFKNNSMLTALEHVLSLDEYKEINEGIEEDEKHEKELVIK